MDNDDRPATKGDLAAVRTELKSDIAHLDAKIDGLEKRLDSRINGLARDIAKTNGRMADVAKLETYGRETVTIPNALGPHGKTLRDHESRIGAIESFRPT